MPPFAGFQGGWLPRIKADDNQRRRIEDIVSRAIERAIKKDPQARAFHESKSVWDHVFSGPSAAVDAAEQAVSFLVHRKVFSVPAPEFRAMVQGKGELGKLRRAIQRLVDRLPDTDASPPWCQMRSQFTGGDPFAVDLSRCGDPDREEDWLRRFHPGILKQMLHEYLRLMDVLVVLSKGTRPFEVPEREFVRSLAACWTQRLGLETTAGRGGSSEPKGDFPDFVRAALDLYPTEALKAEYPDRHKDIKLGPLAGHIREVAKEWSRMGANVAEN
jgi:hypothetical protein